MRAVAFDARWSGAHGIGRFSSELEKGIEFGHVVPHICSPTNPVDCLILSLWRLFNWHRLTFSPGFNAPIFGLSRYVFTVHDLNHIEFPQRNLMHLLYYRFIIRRACRKSAAILTVSEYSKKRIVEWAKVKSEKVTVVGNGVSPIFQPEGKSHQPGYPYYLMVSNRKRHKNEELTLKAFATAKVNANSRVLITGHPTEQLTAYLRELGLEDRVVFLGRCSDDQLATYYRGASALLFVSLYEGFGLPVVEAMACGTPVIASNVCSLPEVAEDAGVLVNPRSLNEIAEAIEKLEHNVSGVREILIRKGLRRSQYYQWDSVVKRVCAVLDVLQ